MARDHGALAAALGILLFALVGPSVAANRTAGAEPQLQIHFHPSVPPSQRPKLQAWVEDTAQQLAEVSNGFPLPGARIEIRQATGGRGPVPWAQVRRGRHEGIHFYVNPSYSARAFARDWTAAHEFSHLLIPYPGDNDIWFSEGLASYYQNLLRSRSGNLSVREGLKAMDAGFHRGQRDARRKNRPLRELSPRMWRTSSYMRVYWSGAAYFLAVDTALRQRAQGLTSLDQVLTAFVRCCRQADRFWDAEALIATFDDLAGGSLFRQHYLNIIDDRRFPDISTSYRWLGLEREGRSLRLLPGAPFDARRRALFSPTNGTANSG